MSVALKILRAGPQICVQDLGRTGTMGAGLSPGGAADRTALAEGAALLGQDLRCAALEMAGFGGRFEVTASARIALTGAPMQASLDGRALMWNASHRIEPGQELALGGTLSGTYGYLHVGGGIATPPFLGSRAAHLASRIGDVVEAGSTLPVGDDRNLEAPGRVLPAATRFDGGIVRVLPSAHTDRFSAETLARFEATEFARTQKGNRQGCELAFDGGPFESDNQLSILSEPMMSGDIQMTGDGHPFVLLPECQTTGGYPRIATVLPDDLPIVAQARPGTKLRFRFILREEALASHMPLARQVASFQAASRPLLRDPRDMGDLLSYQLISGVVDARL